MKLFFTDAAKNRVLVAEADSFAELLAPMIEHQRSRFIYSAGTFTPPGKMEPGSAYCVYSDNKGMTYTVEN